MSLCNIIISIRKHTWHSSSWMLFHTAPEEVLGHLNINGLLDRLTVAVGNMRLCSEERTEGILFLTIHEDCFGVEHSGTLHHESVQVMGTSHCLSGNWWSGQTPSIQWKTWVLPTEGKNMSSIEGKKHSLVFSVQILRGHLLLVSDLKDCFCPNPSD